MNAARESHEQAAGSFGNAAASTADFEAIRLLSLLQEHHKQLSRALASSSKPQKAPKLQQDDGGEATKNKTMEADSPSTTATKKQTAGHSSDANPALATLNARKIPRDLSASLATKSSLANNLAAKRGMLSTQRNSALPPNVTTQHAGGKLVSRGTERPALSSRPSTARKASSSSAVSESPAIDTFSTFYNSLQGLYSKLPASLAFAALPLRVQEEAETEAEVTKQDDTRVRRPKLSSRATADPELSTIFSPATIRALQDDQRTNFAGHESFYVVPTSGGTKSYANIISGSQEDRLFGNDDDTDEFVDARENMGPSSPKSTRSSGTLRRGKKNVAAEPPGSKTREELELENYALKQLLDTQSKRLALWETSAQSQSMRLAQSMRAGARDESLDRHHQCSSESDRVKELKEELIAERAQRESLEHQVDKSQREKDKLLAALGKYKEKWAMLTEKARQRERNKLAKAAEQEQE